MMLFNGGGGEDVYLRWVITALAAFAGGAGVATALSCRSFVRFAAAVLRRSPMQSRAYRSFFQRHATYWWLLGVGMTAHLMMAVSHTGIPLPADPDPDAGVHRASLGLGAGIALAALGVLFSCRIVPRLIGRRGFLAGGAYTSYTRYHSYLWVPFAVFVAVHAVIGLRHGF